MNWIDDKYKDKLGNKKFPDSLKKAGWAKAEELLDKEMPVKRGGFFNFKYILVFVLGLSIPMVIWYFNNGEQTVDDKPLNVITNNMDEVSHGNNVKETGTSTVAEQGKKESDNVVSTEQFNTQSDKNSHKGTISGVTEENANASEGNVIEENTTVVAQDNRIISSELQKNNSGDKNQTVVYNNDLNAANSLLPDNDQDADHIEKNSKDDPKEFNASKDLDSKPDTQDHGGALNEDLSKDADDPNSMSGRATAKQETTLDKPEQNTSDKSDESSLDKGTGNSTQEETNNSSKPDESKDDIGALPANSSGPLKSKSRVKNHLAFLELSDDLVTSGDGYQLFSRERFSLSLWAGYSYVDKFLTASNRAYVDKRTAEENVIRTIPTGVDLDYFINKNWTFGTGIGWSEYGEDLNYNLSRRDTAWIDGRWQSPSNFNGVVQVDSTRIIDSIFVGHWNYRVIHDTKDSNALANNGRTSWQYIEIPFTVGYRFGRGRLKPWLKTGISVGIPVATSYRYLNLQATDLNSEGLNNTLTAPVQYSYLVDLGLDTYLSRNISVRLSGFGSLQLNSSLRQDAIKQRYYRIGMRIGVAYNF